MIPACLTTLLRNESRELAGRLTQLFNCRGQLASDEVQLLLWQMLHVLKYLHANHVWHRDLKSANVLVKLEGGQRIIKVHHSHGNTSVECCNKTACPMAAVALTAPSALSVLLLGFWNQMGARYS